MQRHGCIRWLLHAAGRRSQYERMPGLPENSDRTQGRVEGGLLPDAAPSRAGWWHMRHCPPCQAAGGPAAAIEHSSRSGSTAVRELLFSLASCTVIHYNAPFIPWNILLVV